MSGVLQVTGVVDAVASELRAAVFEGELTQGQLVTEAWAAERYGVARASAKAAIEKLVAEGLLQRDCPEVEHGGDLDEHVDDEDERGVC